MSYLVCLIFKLSFIWSKTRIEKIVNIVKTLAALFYIGSLWNVLRILDIWFSPFLGSYIDEIWTMILVADFIIDLFWLCALCHRYTGDYFRVIMAVLLLRTLLLWHSWSCSLSFYDMTLLYFRMACIWYEKALRVVISLIPYKSSTSQKCITSL